MLLLLFESLFKTVFYTVNDNIAMYDVDFIE